MRDQRVEQWLKASRVQVRYLDRVPLDEIDAVVSAHNSGRLYRRLVESTVDEYATAMRAGVQFPALVAARLETGQLWLINGNHRLHAARAAGLEQFDVYEVVSDDAYTLDMLTRTANWLEGMRPSRDELIEQGLHLVATYQRPAKEIAARLGLPIGALEAAGAIRRTQHRLSKAGSDRAAALPQVALRTLAGVPTDAALVQAAALVDDAALGAPQVQELVSEIRAETTEAGQVAVVHHWWGRPDIQKRREHVVSGAARTLRPQERLLRTLTSADNLLARYPTAAQLQLTTPREREDLAALWGRLAVRMQEVLGASADGADRPVARVAG